MTPSGQRREGKQASLVEGLRLAFVCISLLRRAARPVLLSLLQQSTSGRKKRQECFQTTPAEERLQGTYPLAFSAPCPGSLLCRDFSPVGTDRVMVPTPGLLCLETAQGDQVDLTLGTSVGGKQPLTLISREVKCSTRPCGLH